MKSTVFYLLFLLHDFSCSSTCIIRYNVAECRDVKSLPLMITEVVKNVTILSSYLPRIQAYSFSNAPRIQFLTLTSNDISFIEANAFTGLIDLKMLYLDQNKIRFISSTAFEKSGIRAVNISYNKLKEFPKALTNIPSLKEVDLRFNDISAVKYPLTPLKNLEVLLLQNNSLTNIDPAVFKGLRKLRIANLTGNPYHCDCNLPRFDNWLSSFYFSRHSTELLGEYRCVSPPELKGKPFDAFNVHGACLSPQLPKSAANVAEINTILIGTCVVWIYNMGISL